MTCMRCNSCGSTESLKWFIPKIGQSENQVEEPTKQLLLCERCISLRNTGNFCPLCCGCYEDDDYDTKMMECAQCSQWIHAKCEGLSTEKYEILSALPDSVEYVCRQCQPEPMSGWLQAVSDELLAGLSSVLDSLINSKCAKHIVRRDNGRDFQRLQFPLHVSSRDNLSQSCIERNGKLLDDTASGAENASSRVVSPVNREANGSEHIITASVAGIESVNAIQSDMKVENRMNGVRYANSTNRLVFASNATAEKLTVSNESTTTDLLQVTNENVESVVQTDLITKATINKKLPAKKLATEQIPLRAFRVTRSSVTLAAPSDVKLLKCQVQLKDIGATTNVQVVSVPDACNTAAITNCVMPNDIDPKCLQKAVVDLVKLNTVEVSKFVSQLDGPNDELDLQLQNSNSFQPKSESNVPTLSITELSMEEDSGLLVRHRISKDIDDDCLSTEESSSFDTDSEIESIQDDVDDPRDLVGLKKWVMDCKYDSVAQFHVDLLRIIQTGKKFDYSQHNDILTIYSNLIKERFVWFDINTINVFDLVDHFHPFPAPYSDHLYFVPGQGTANSVRGNGNFLLSSESPHKKSISPVVGNNDPSPCKDRRKCVLCLKFGDGVLEGSGRLLYLGQDEWLHVNCALWSSEVYEEIDGALQNVYEAVSRGRQIKCSACPEKGSTVGCCHKGCVATYHFHCAIRIACQFRDNRTILCPLHKTQTEMDKLPDFHVNRCVFIEMDSEKKKWKQVPSNRVQIMIGSLVVTNLGRIVTQSDNESALIPINFVCRRQYWSTIDPTRRVLYTCRVRLVTPTIADSAMVDLEDGLNFHRTINHSLDQESVHQELALVARWQRYLQQQELEASYMKSNIIPPHLCPLYQTICPRELPELRPITCELTVADAEFAINAEGVDAVDEESLMLDSYLPTMVGAMDNDLISMVLNDLDDSSDPSMESARQSPIDMELLNACHQLMENNLANSVCQDDMVAVESCPISSQDNNYLMHFSEEPGSLSSVQSKRQFEGQLDCGDITAFEDQTVGNQELEQMCYSLPLADSADVDNNIEAATSSVMQLDEEELDQGVTSAISPTLGENGNNLSRQVCRVTPMPSDNCRQSSSTEEISNSRLQLPVTETIQMTENEDGYEAQICMKRNYKTVIKKYPLRSGASGRKNEPYETVRIEIKETIEIPRGDGSGLLRRRCQKRQYNGVMRSCDDEGSVVVSPTRVEKTSVEVASETPDPTGSKKVVKFTDDSNDITVSIVNNNNNVSNEFSTAKSRILRRYRQKTIVQLDGTVDLSSCESTNSSGDEDPPATQQTGSLAMRIKQHSLAHSCPGAEGPLKCHKCRRFYRTKESFQKHFATCTFEVESSSTEDDDQTAHFPQVQQTVLEEPVRADGYESTTTVIPDHDSVELEQDYSPIQASYGHIQHDQSHENSENKESYHETTSEHEVSISIEPNPKRSRIECFAIPRQPGVHRQVRSAIKNVTGSEKDEIIGVNNVPGENVSPGDVFVPPCQSPVKSMGAAVRRSTGSPRRSSCSWLVNSNRIKRIPMPVQPCNTNISAHSESAGSELHKSTEVSMQINLPSDNAQCQIIAPSISTTLYQGYSEGQSDQFSSVPLLTTLQTNQPQLLTVMPSPSVAVPQGYTVQYVGSYRDNSSSTLIPYPSSIVMSQPQMLMAQDNQTFMTQFNTGATYSFASPETLLFNQPTLMQPAMQFVQPQTMFQSDMQVLPTIFNYAPTTGSNYAMPTVCNSALPLDQLNSFTIVKNSHSEPNLNPPQPLIISPSSQVLEVSEVSLSGSSSENSACSSLQFMASGSENCENCPRIPVTPIKPLSPTDVTKSPLSSPYYRPQASVLPQGMAASSSLCLSNMPSPQKCPGNGEVLHGATDFTGLPPRVPFGGDRLPPRTVATVAPALITSSPPTTVHSSPIRHSDSDVNIPPRPSYSYRDAMRMPLPTLDGLKLPLHVNTNEGSKMSSEELSDTDQGTQTLSNGSEVSCIQAKESIEAEGTEVQSYRLVLRRDSSKQNGYDIMPMPAPMSCQMSPVPEVRELRIKAKISVGPKRKKLPKGAMTPEGDMIYGSIDTTHERHVNEQCPAAELPPQLNFPIDSSLVEKPLPSSAEPYIVFELTSDEGFHVESRHISEVWQKVFEAVAAARASMRLDSLSEGMAGLPGGAASGLHMLGLTHNAVQYLLEQLPGAKDCHKYSFQFHQRPETDSILERNPSGCARSEPFKLRAPYDVFSWLASKHRRLPQRSYVLQDEIQLAVTRRPTSLELPMAMRYRHLRETAREAVGVFRSSIHGRGLFCKRDIDAGEMVIEYAGQVIRSGLCDRREKFYESKGIGCYMFRIDDDVVIDATMHGNAARFINHSCDPNCYSRIVDILGMKHIIIFALRKILIGEELTYDYKFPIEDDKLRCTCGTKRCRKFLN